jgi:peptidoglycan hydrolase-like protein with peptidoglycan-binding domain
MSGLPSTGRADLETWNRLFSDYRRSLERNRQGEGFYIFPRMPIDYVLEPDGEQFLVTVVQYILNELRVLYDDIPLNDQGGRYDENTREGVSVFQKRNGLARTGLVDRATWNALADAHHRLSSRGEI